MRRTGIHKPTIEDMIELSGIETLHPGGLELTRRTAEVAKLKEGLKVLDVSSGRGTQAILYAKEYGAEVTGLDLSADMVSTATEAAGITGIRDRVRFRQGDSQEMPFDAASFDVVINECAVGIPDDSQRVLDEMVRVLRPGGTIVIHESTWLKTLPEHETSDLSERYGTTPLRRDEWQSMLERAGVVQIQYELERWSAPEVFWNIRCERTVKNYREILTLKERLRTVSRLLRTYGPIGALKGLENESKFHRAVQDRKLGYCLFWGFKPIDHP